MANNKAENICFTSGPPENRIALWPKTRIFLRYVAGLVFRTQCGTVRFIDGPAGCRESVQSWTRTKNQVRRVHECA